MAGGRILNLSWKGVKFSLKGLNDIKLHLKRFGKSSQNEKAIKRIQDILDGKIEISDYDRIFYTHELQEYSRYKALGIADGINDSKVWDNCHAATLEDFKINEKTTSVYHPDTEPTIEDLLNEN